MRPFMVKLRNGLLGLPLLAPGLAMLALRPRNVLLLLVVWTVNTMAVGPRKQRLLQVGGTMVLVAVLGQLLRVQAATMWAAALVGVVMFAVGYASIWVGRARRRSLVFHARDRAIAQMHATATLGIVVLLRGEPWGGPWLPAALAAAALLGCLLAVPFQLDAWLRLRRLDPRRLLRYAKPGESEVDYGLGPESEVLELEPRDYRTDGRSRVLVVRGNRPAALVALRECAILALINASLSFAAARFVLFS